MAIKPEQTGSLNQFKRGMSTPWKQQSIVISGNALKTINFLDTAQNMFFIQNPNNAVIHVGISTLPTLANYEFKVEPNSTRCFGRPAPTNTLYLLNKGNAEITVQLMSIYGEFDLSILQSTSVDLSGASMTYDGIINGFSAGVSLPSGTNRIGTVGVDGAVALAGTAQTDLASTADGVETLVDDEEHGGKINLYSLWKKLDAFQTEQKANIEAVLAGIAGAGNAPYSDMKFYYGELLTSDTTIDLTTVTPDFINFITNDSSSDLIVELYRTETEFTSVILKESDSISDIPYRLVKLVLKPRNGGETYSYRCLLAKRG